LLEDPCQVLSRLNASEALERSLDRLLLLNPDDFASTEEDSRLHSSKMAVSYGGLLSVPTAKWNDGLSNTPDNNIDIL